MDILKHRVYYAIKSILFLQNLQSLVELYAVFELDI